MPNTLFCVITAIPALVLTCQQVHGQLTFTDLEAVARVEASSTNSENFEFLLDENEQVLQNIGSLVGDISATSAANGGNSFARSEYDITQNADGFRFISELTSQASLGSAFGLNATSGAGITATFSTLQTTDIVISGAFVLDQPLPTGALGPNTVDIRVQLIGGAGSLPNQFINFQYVMSSFLGGTENELRFIDIATIAPDGEYTIVVQATVIAGVGLGGSAGPADISGRFTMRLDHLDDDEDGLFNTWETDGVDFEIDGIPEIDLPGDGATSDRKDLFVEIDTHSGIMLGQSLLDQVSDAFDAAPVSNPSGNDGIFLHFELDETSLPNIDYQQNYITKTGNVKTQMLQQRQAFFGTSAQRSDSDAQVLLKAKSLIYRYGVVGGIQTYTFIDPNAVPMPMERTIRVGGMAEIPGEDFIITLRDPNDRPEDMAATIMHEFGHNLGLRHGGGDNTNFKPNYFSVMNYMHALQRDNWGSRWNDNLQLDYSRAQLPDVDESSLSEPIGIGSNDPSSSGRLFAFANDNPINPNGSTRIWIADGSPGAPVDWDIDGSTNAIGIELDVSQSNMNSPESIEVHTGHDDWSNLYYKIRGHENFGLGALAEGDSTLDLEIGELSFEENDMLNNMPVVYLDEAEPCPADFTGEGDLNFLDVSAFLTAYANQDPTADFTGEGLFNFLDVSAFLSAFAVGCP